MGNYGVLVVAITALSAASVHLWRFAQGGGEALPTVLGLVTFTVPGVIVGGRLGPVLSEVSGAPVPGRGVGGCAAIVP